MAQWLERATDNRVVAVSNPAEAVWKLWQLPEFFQPMTHVCADRELVSYVVPYVHRRGTNSNSENPEREVGYTNHHIDVNAPYLYWLKKRFDRVWSDALWLVMKK